MDSLFFAATAAVIVAVLCEGILWWIFRQKLSPLIFPHELDTSYFRFASPQHLRLAAILHTVFVIICIVFCCIYLW